MSLHHFAVVGNPIAHSLSPQIHRAFAEKTGRQIDYRRYTIATEGDAFECFVRDFFKQGGRGLNITLPFKERAFRSVDQLTERAQEAGAVNTLIPLSSTVILGDNTDGLGLVRDLQGIQKQAIAGKHILILGTGGAARGIVPALKAQHPVEITMVSRTGFPSYRDLEKTYDIIINATPLSLTYDLPDIHETILRPDSFCYDLVYDKSRETVFTRWAKAAGVKSADGFGMLVQQAAEAFCQWHGFCPEIDSLMSNCVDFNQFCATVLENNNNT